MNIDTNKNYEASKEEHVTKIDKNFMENVTILYLKA